MQTCVNSLVRQAGFNSVEALDRRILVLAGHLLRGNSLALNGAYCVDRLRSDVWHKLLRRDERGLRALANAESADAYLKAMVQNQLFDVARREASQRRRLERETNSSSPALQARPASEDSAAIRQFLERAAAFVEEHGDALDGIVFRELMLRKNVAVKLAEQLNVTPGRLYVRKTRLKALIRRELGQVKSRS